MADTKDLVQRIKENSVKYVGKFGALAQKYWNRYFIFYEWKVNPKKNYSTFEIPPKSDESTHIMNVYYVPLRRSASQTVSLPKDSNAVIAENLETSVEETKYSGRFELAEVPKLSHIVRFEDFGAKFINGRFKDGYHKTYNAEGDIVLLKFKEFSEFKSELVAYLQNIGIDFGQFKTFFKNSNLPYLQRYFITELISGHLYTMIFLKLPQKPGK